MPVVLGAVLVVLLLGVGVALALLRADSSALRTSTPTAPTAPSREPVASFTDDDLRQAMDEATEAGPNSIKCSRVARARLTCNEIPDGEVASAVRRGDPIYLRMVLGFTDGADAERDSVPTFERSDLICDSGVGGSLSCQRVTVAPPTVRVGQRLFVFYRWNQVTFDDAEGTIISQTSEPTIPLRVLP
jgi:hypothetical protein